MQVVVRMTEQNNKKFDFIDFMSECADPQNGVQLLNDFHAVLASNDKIKLYEWFGQIGYVITFEDCEKMLKNKTMLQDFRTNINNNGY